jgi:hypothetical protein
MHAAPVVIACIVVLIVIAGVYLVKRSKTQTQATREGFYTEYADEEPTRSDVPYTGTIPYGYWGTKPWAEEFPVPRGDAGCCARQRLRDVEVGTDINPICKTCGSTRKDGGPERGYFIDGLHGELY